MSDLGICRFPQYVSFRNQEYIKMSDMECRVHMHMCKKITLKQYVELAKAVKEVYENKCTITLRNELINNLYS